MSTEVNSAGPVRANYDQLIFDEIMVRFDIVCQLGLEDSYLDQAYVEIPIKVSKEDKGSQYIKALWDSSLMKQVKYNKERKEAKRLCTQP